MSKKINQQLQSIKNRALSGQTIDNCYELLYNRDLWTIAWKRMVKGTFHCYRVNGTPDFILQFIDSCIHSLKQNEENFITSMMKQYGRNLIRDSRKLKLIYTVLTMILEIIDPDTNSKIKRSTNQWSETHRILKQVNEWDPDTWKCKITIEPETIHRSVFEKSFQNQLTDQRMIALFTESLQIIVDHKFHYYEPFDENDLYGAYWRKLWNLYVQGINHWLTTNVHNKKTNMIHFGNRLQMNYIHHDQQWLIAFKGNKELMKQLELKIVQFITNYLQVNDDEILHHLLHPHESFKFARFFITKRHQNSSYLNNTNYKLLIPDEELHVFSMNHQYGDFYKYESNHRSELASWFDNLILKQYNKELMQISQYYRIADNFHHLRKLFDLAKSSFLKTLAFRRNVSVSKIMKRLQSEQIVEGKVQFNIHESIVNSFIRYSDVKKQLLKLNA